jgi:4-alpha-glucanotransferase
MTGAGPSRRISLALTLHNHQPIGNFGWVFAEVFDKAYAPMVEALERHPGVRVGLHYSGPLLEWLLAERPGFIGSLRALIDRGQVEILGGGLYEPVLAAIPERDRIAQLTRMAEALEEAFGARPTGAWLAERVWEPDLPTSLVDAGYRWTILDDSHFRAASIPDDTLWGPYTTDDQGRRLTVFATDKRLRYLIPFHDVEQVIAYLREHATDAGDRLGTMGDDGEKFGAWPSTFEHCWGKNAWVERFFRALEDNADWLTTVRPADWLETHSPIGRAYIPTGSYAEMGEWALPAEESLAFSAVLKRARDKQAPEERWLRGAFWRNYQVKYREINDLHKQMLRASTKVEAMDDGPDREVALDHLHRGQSNDCYWHGLFGGIYIAHMRAATLGHLIAAEDMADAALNAMEGADTGDVDLDGRDEVRLANAGEIIVVDIDEGGGIGSWDLRAARHGLTGVLRRRPEAYHETLRRHDRQASKRSKPGDAPASIHEMVQVKEAGLAGRLVYDDYERRSGLIRFFAPEVTADTWNAGGRGELGDFVAAPFTIDRLVPDALRLSRDGTVAIGGRAHAVRLEVELRIDGGRLDPTLGQRVTIENRGSEALEARIGSEWAMTMLGGGGNPEAWWELDGERTSHDATRSSSGVGRLAQGNDWLGVALATQVEPQADVWIAPLETISNSEAGFERVYQGSALLLSWPIRLDPGERWAASVSHEASIGDAAAVRGEVAAS